MRYEVRKLINGVGYVVVDTTWKEKMMGPFINKQDAEKRCKEMNG
jgi:hypothetical protein